MSRNGRRLFPTATSNLPPPPIVWPKVKNLTGQMIERKKWLLENERSTVQKGIYLVIQEVFPLLPLYSPHKHSFLSIRRGYHEINKKEIAAPRRILRGIGYSPRRRRRIDRDNIFPSRSCDPVPLLLPSTALAFEREDWLSLIKGNTTQEDSPARINVHNGYCKLAVRLTQFDGGRNRMDGGGSHGWANV